MLSQYRGVTHKLALFLDDLASQGHPEVQVSRVTLADKLECSPRQASRAVKTLQDDGIINVRRGGRGGSSTYTYMQLPVQKTAPAWGD